VLTVIAVIIVTLSFFSRERTCAKKEK